jgi:tRNA pseudouridine38-40 synthase
MTRTIKLVLEYDGTDFSGWQLQPGERTVQLELEGALERLLKEKVRIHGAGRTDAGVHALGQVASFETQSQIPLKAFREGLNTILPPDVAVLVAEEAPEGFEARHWARGKRYRYRVLNRRVRSPLLSRYSWWQKRPWELAALRAAIPALLGEHDFTSFRASGCQAKHPVRVVRAIDLTSRGDEIELTFEATAFLKQMVRNIVGTLAEVALGKIPPEAVAEILAARDRRRAGPTAPPQGLTLLEVFY